MAFDVPAAPSSASEAVISAGGELENGVGEAEETGGLTQPGNIKSSSTQSGVAKADVRDGAVKKEPEVNGEVQPRQTRKRKALAGDDDGRGVGKEPVRKRTRSTRA